MLDRIEINRLCKSGIPIARGGADYRGQRDEDVRFTGQPPHHFFVPDVAMDEREAGLGTEVEETLLAIEQVIQNRDAESALQQVSTEDRAQKARRLP